MRDTAMNGVDTRRMKWETRNEARAYKTAGTSVPFKVKFIFFPSVSISDEWSHGPFARHTCTQCA
jgi:hypothetical protein